MIYGDFPSAVAGESLCSSIGGATLYLKASVAAYGTNNGLFVKTAAEDAKWAYKEDLGERRSAPSPARNTCHFKISCSGEDDVTLHDMV